MHYVVKFHKPDDDCWFYYTKSVILSDRYIADLHAREEIVPCVVFDSLPAAKYAYNELIMSGRKLSFIKIASVLSPSLVEIEVLPNYWRNFNDK